MQSKTEKAKAANVELRINQWPIGLGSSIFEGMKDSIGEAEPFTANFGLSFMDWRGDMAVGGNGTINVDAGVVNTTIKTNINSRGQGSINLRIASNELAWLGIIGVG